MGDAALDLLQCLEEELQIEVIEQFDIQGASVASTVLQHLHVHGQMGFTATHQQMGLPGSYTVLCSLLRLAAVFTSLDLWLSGCPGSNPGHFAFWQPCPQPCLCRPPPSRSQGLACTGLEEVLHTAGSVVDSKQKLVDTSSGREGLVVGQRSCRRRSGSTKRSLKPPHPSPSAPRWLGIPARES